MSRCHELAPHPPHRLAVAITGGKIMADCDGVAALAPNGCDECSVEPGETHDATCPGADIHHPKGPLTAEPAAQHPLSGGDAERALSERVNWDLIQRLAAKPHKHLNIVEGERYGLMVDGEFDTANNGVGEVMQEARTVQHLLDMAGVPEGWNYTAHIDARVFLLISDLLAARERLARIASWHSLETGPGGMVGLYCIECGTGHPCETRRMADGTHEDLAVLPADVVDPAARAEAEYDEATQELATELAEERILHQETMRERDQLRAEVARVRADVIDEILADLKPEIDWQHEHYGQGTDKTGMGRLIGMQDAYRTVEKHRAAPSVRPDTDRTPDVGTPDPQRYWWQHDDCDSGPVAGAADWPGRPCTGCGMSLGGWTRGAPIAAGSVPSLPEETPDA